MAAVEFVDSIIVKLYQSYRWSAIKSDSFYLVFLAFFAVVPAATADSGRVAAERVRCNGSRSVVSITNFWTDESIKVEYLLPGGSKRQHLSTLQPGQSKYLNVSEDGLLQVFASGPEICETDSFSPVCVSAITLELCGSGPKVGIPESSGGHGQSFKQVSFQPPVGGGGPIHGRVCQGYSCYSSVSSQDDTGSGESGSELRLIGYLLDNQYLSQVSIVTVQLAGEVESKPVSVEVCRRPPSSNPKQKTICRSVVLADGAIGSRFDFIVNSPRGWREKISLPGSDDRVLVTDSILNGLGGEPDEYSVIAVYASASIDAHLIIYKPDLRLSSSPGFGESGFDFALYYPAIKPVDYAVSYPVNTFKDAVGIDRDASLANWFTIADGECGNGKGVLGSIVYTSNDGATTFIEAVSQQDCSRFDYAAHAGKIEPPREVCFAREGSVEESVDAVDGNCPSPAYVKKFKEPEVAGVATFVPHASSDSVLAAFARFAYDCSGGGASCSHHLTASTIPPIVQVGDDIRAFASVRDYEFSIIEVSSQGTPGATSNLMASAFHEGGKSLGYSILGLKGFGVRHLVVNKLGQVGFVEEGQLAQIRFSAEAGSVTGQALTMSYLRSKNTGELEYMYASSGLPALGQTQTLPFNTFLSHQNELEVNAFDEQLNCEVSLQDVSSRKAVAFINGALVAPLRIDANGVRRMPLTNLPANTYGTITLACDSPKVNARVLIKKINQYVIPINAR